jgi:hypothetical protein
VAGGRVTRGLALAALVAPLPAVAHGFGRLYNLPVPFWLYGFGASAALLLSFLVVGYFIGRRAGDASPPGRPVESWEETLRRWRILGVARGIALGALLLCIVAGLLGSRDPYRNFSMIAFWIVFVLGFTYFVAIVGDLFEAINPWRSLAGGVARLRSDFTRGRVRYPEGLGDWPALVLYLGLIWFELFGHSKPFALAAVLAGYTAINLGGVWLVGSGAWFRHCELFSVFFRLVGTMAPRGRAPFVGILDARPQHLSTVVFVLAMLSTTAFDGLRETQWWVALFWKNAWLQGFIDKPLMHMLAVLRPWYRGWEMFWLLASPFVYFAAYALFVVLAKVVTRSERPLRELFLDFAYTLLPIALVYNVTHYFTLLLSDALKIVSLLSDPFGWNWNLFGTATLLRAPILLDVGVVWHIQVVLILAGHIVSVYLAHRVALSVFPTRRAAVLSQLPMLCLMVLFTVAGLWILAQPLTDVRSM